MKHETFQRPAGRTDALCCVFYVSFEHMKKLHRFIGNFDLTAARLLIREPGLIHQLRDVLKLRVGEKIVLADGRGAEAPCELAAIDKTGIEIAVGEMRESDEPKRRVILYCAILKRENFEYAIEKAVECGVASIVPIITAHTVKLGLNLERLRKIAQEAAEQCGRAVVPEITDAVKFAAALKAAGENDINYFFDAAGEEFARAKSLAEAVGVWIGPEGGWEAFESNTAREAGFAVASLGPLILRAETAAAVAVYLAAR
jgi:16S rRNA (uracil1498-N3)-methyltransferase